MCLKLLWTAILDVISEHSNFLSCVSCVEVMNNLFLGIQAKRI